MTKVFIGGSRRLSRLNSDIRARLDRIVEKSLPVVVGDANGADKAVQSYLKDRHYPLVEVFCSDQSPRNNLGGWPQQVIRPRGDVRDFDYYATKDRQMAREATVGLMLWDGQSRGTLLNVLRLVAQDKPTVVYVGPNGTFADTRDRRSLDKLVAALDHDDARRFHDQAAREGLEEAAVGQRGLPLHS